MRIGTILTLATNDAHSTASPRSGNRRCKRLFANVPNAQLEVLGKSLLDRTIEKLQQSGVKSTHIISEGSTLTQLLPPRITVADDFISAWEKSVADYVQQGIETLLLLRTSSYSDVNYEEVFRFHAERGAELTQVYGEDGSLDIAVVDARALRNGDGAFRKRFSSLMLEHERFYFYGYVNRLRKPQDFRRLTEDGLTGKCGLRPCGREVGPGIWFGAGAEVDDSCTIDGPGFVGAGSRIAACCTIGPGSVIERNCEIDCGTTVEDSWILQETYVGLGLNVRRSIVSNQKMFHLDRKAEIAISDPRLIRATKSLPFSGTGAASLNTFP